MQKRPFATNQTSNKETVHCKHQDRKPVNYGLCEECYSDVSLRFYASFHVFCLRNFETLANGYES